MRRAVLVLGMCVAAAGQATGAPADSSAPDDARVLSADPNVPLFGLEFRGAARATFGSPIRPLTGADGLQVALVPLLELHDAIGSPNAIPFENWRGRLEIHGGWRVTRATYAATGWLGLEHESDHPTLWRGPYPTHSYFTLNSAVARAELTLPLGPLALTVVAIERFHLDTCTSVFPECARAVGDGSPAFEQGAEAVADGSAGAAFSFRPFGSIAMSWLFPSSRVVGEKRLALRAGLRVRQRAGGLWQLYLAALFGNDVGVFRHDTVTELGGGAAFSF
jgi:hypothetical protein